MLLNSSTEFSVPPHDPPARSAPQSRLRETMGRIELFRSLDAAAIAELDRQSTWRKYSRNDWIVELDDTGSDVFFIISGTVRVKIPEPSGREVLFQDLDAGSYFGEMDAIDGKPRAIGVMAVTDATIARMPREVFRKTICRHSDAADQVSSASPGSSERSPIAFANSPPSTSSIASMPNCCGCRSRRAARKMSRSSPRRRSRRRSPPASAPGVRRLRVK